VCAHESESCKQPELFCFLDKEEAEEKKKGWNHRKDSISLDSVVQLQRCKRHMHKYTLSMHRKKKPASSVKCRSWKAREKRSRGGCAGVSNEKRGFTSCLGAVDSEGEGQ
jgi:hypothetical protein